MDLKHYWKKFQLIYQRKKITQTSLTQKILMKGQTFIQHEIDFNSDSIIVGITTY